MNPANPKRVTHHSVLARFVGVAFLFSGAALLMHILWKFPLPIGLVGTVVLATGGFVFFWRRVDTSTREQLVVHLKIGVLAGIAAIIAYDIAKWGLAVIDPSPFNPFGAIPTFGALLVGPTAPEIWLIAAGIGYHVLNGITFAVAYCILFGYRGILAGIGWGVFLEAFQFTLYPGWLNITAFYAEFVTISFLGHIAYGATLGYVCKRGLLRSSMAGIPKGLKV